MYASPKQVTFHWPDQSEAQSGTRFSNAAFAFLPRHHASHLCWMCGWCLQEQCTNLAREAQSNRGKQRQKRIQKDDVPHTIQDAIHEKKQGRGVILDCPPHSISERRAFALEVQCCSLGKVLYRSCNIAPAIQQFHAIPSAVEARPLWRRVKNSLICKCKQWGIAVAERTAVVLTGHNRKVRHQWQPTNVWQDASAPAESNP